MSLPWIELSKGLYLEAPDVHLPWSVGVAEFRKIFPDAICSKISRKGLRLETICPRQVVRSCGACGTALVCSFSIELVSIGFNFCEVEGASTIATTVKKLRDALRSQLGSAKKVEEPFAGCQEIWKLDHWSITLGWYERFVAHHYLSVEKASHA